MRGLTGAGWSGWLLFCGTAALGCSGELASVADADNALTVAKAFPACDNVTGAPSSFTSFQDGRTLDGSLYSGASDAWLDRATPTSNLGGDAECAIKGGGQPRSCLFRWDLSSIPNTSQVLGACLELTIDDPSVRSFDAFELERTASYWMLVPLWNFFSLMGSPKGYGEARRKQLDLIELSFLKHRRRRGERGQELDAREHELRSRIHMSNQAGVFIGART